MKQLNKIGRNDLCNCGSGKKYKYCCLRSNNNYLKFQQIMNSFVHNFDPKQEEIYSIINEIELLINGNTFSKQQNEDIKINIIQIYAKGGYDNKVLEIINTIDINSISHINGKIYILTNKMHCSLNLGIWKDACLIAIQLLEMVKLLKWGDKLESSMKSGAMIEAAKTLNLIQNELDDNSFDTIILETYNELIDAYECEKYNDIDHYVGSLANKAYIFMHSNDDEMIKLGLLSLDKVTKLKLQIGYWNGVSNDYCRLGLFYLKKKDYIQAIAYTKRDLVIVREYGSKREEISTILNLVKIYRELKQYSEARYYLKQIESISIYTQNSGIYEYCQKLRDEINEEAKQLAIQGITIGKKSLCACGSGNKYDECCGKADFDYKEIDKVIGLDSIIPYSRIVDNNKSVLKKEDQLNSLLKPVDENEKRFSFINIVNNGAYQEVYELPDMGTIHIQSAKTLLDHYPDDDLLVEVSHSLSISMLSVSALEAFLNQLVYFLYSIPEDSLPDFMKGKIPIEIRDNHMDYQRYTSFTEKIGVIGNIFCNGKWTKQAFKNYDELYKLIIIRNELVHFKSMEYYKIIPPNDNYDILKGLPSKVKLRDISNSWPLRLLNKTFAEWSYETINSAINYIKDTYYLNI